MLDGQVQLCFIRQSLSSSESSSIEGKFLNTPQARPCLLGVVYCLGIVFLVLFCIKRCVCLHMIPECFRWSSCDACFHILCCLICSSPLSNCSFELAVCSDSCGFLFEFRVVVYQKRGRSWLFSFSFHSHYSPSALASNLAQRSPCLETRNLKRQTNAVRFPLGCGCLYHVPLLCLPCCCCTFKRSCCFSNCRCLVFLAAASSALARVRAGCSAGTGAGRVRIRPTPALAHAQAQLDSGPAAAPHQPAAAFCSRRGGSQVRWLGSLGFIGGRGRTSKVAVGPATEVGHNAKCMHVTTGMHMRLLPRHISSRMHMHSRAYVPLPWSPQDDDEQCHDAGHEEVKETLEEALDQSFLPTQLSGANMIRT